MDDALGKLSKDAETMAHQMVLMRDQVAELEAANAAATRCKSYKRRRVQKKDPYSQR
jgi:hypothetical protein